MFPQMTNLYSQNASKTPIPGHKLISEVNIFFFLCVQDSVTFPPSSENFQIKNVKNTILIRLGL